ncbi:MAG: hypothetical protein ABI873_14245 [Marmoricola sp.]
MTLRPAPDTMSYLTGLLPVAQGVAVFAALTRHVDSCRAQGDARTRGQIMADTLVERVTGQATAAATPVAVHLVMSDATLLAGSSEPAHLEEYGTIPAAVARDLAADAEAAWIRRLYTSPATGELVAMDSRARLFPAGLDRLIRIRDQICRTPWCDAPIRAADHVEERTSGGETSAGNGQGLCEHCNHVKQAVGWRARPRPGPTHTVETKRQPGTPIPRLPPTLRRPHAPPGSSATRASGPDPPPDLTSCRRCASTGHGHQHHDPTDRSAPHRRRRRRRARAQHRP